MRGCTLIRILINLNLRASTPGAVSGQQLAWFGIGLYSEEAFAAAVLPDAQTSSEFPVGGWLWREAILVVDETLANGPMPLQVVSRDLRAMRKLDRGALILTFHNQAVEGTTFNVRCNGMVRCLYKLP